MAVCHWSCRNALEARSSDMEQGAGPEPQTGLYGEGAGESWLSLLSNPAETVSNKLNDPVLIAKGSGFVGFKLGAA